MAVQMPSGNELLDFELPVDNLGIATEAFSKIRNRFKLTWKAFLVATADERLLLYDDLEMNSSSKEALEIALRFDERKITVRRCIWDATIRDALELLPRRGVEGEPVGVAPAQPPTIPPPARHVDPTALSSNGAFAEDDEDRSSTTTSSSSSTSTASSNKATCESSDDDSDTGLPLTKRTNPLAVLDDVDKLAGKGGYKQLDSGPEQDADDAGHVGPLLLEAPPIRAEQPVASFAVRKHIFPAINYLAAGIENQGNTCYLSASLQTLFYIPYFRSCVFGMDTAAMKGKDVVEALQGLFAALQLQYKGTTTVPLTTAFRWSAEEVGRQHDVHEMMLILFDFLEKPLTASNARSESLTSGTSRSEAATDGCTHSDDSPQSGTNFVQKLFRGQQSYVTRCVEAQYESRQSEPFLVIEVPVQGFSTLYQSLDEITSPSSIEGFVIENETTKAKSTHTVERALRFTELPPVLLIHPNRVVFDFESLQQVTVNNEWHFPLTLDLSSYAVLQHNSPSAPEETPSTNDDEESTQTERQKEEGQAAARNRCEQMQREGSLFQSDDSDEIGGLTEYELRAIVLHKGNAAHGHYTTCIRHSEGLWHEFNDTTCHSVLESSVLQRASGYTPLYTRSSERAKLLVYVRKSSIPRLFVEPALPPHITALADPHLPKVRLEYCLMDHAFAEAFGKRQWSAGAEPLKWHRVQLPTKITIAEAKVHIAKKHDVNPERIIIWKYGYHMIQYESDKAVRVPDSSVLEERMAHIVVEILPEVDVAEASSITCCFPTIALIGGEVQFLGVKRSVEEAMDAAAEEERLLAQVQAQASSSMWPASSSENEAGSESAVQQVEVELAAGVEAPPKRSEWNAEDVAWSVYVLSESTLSNPYAVSQFGTKRLLVSGCILVVAPTSVARDALQQQVLRVPIDITFYVISRTNADDGIELFTLTVDDNTTYAQLQMIVHRHLTESGESGVFPFISEYYPFTPRQLGFHSHCIDTCGPSRSLVNLESRATVNTMLRGGASSHYHSTTVIRRLYMEVLPEDISPYFDNNRCLFVVSTGFSRRALTYAYARTYSTADEFLECVLPQAAEFLEEIHRMDKNDFRIVGVDWNGNIVCTYVGPQRVSWRQGMQYWLVDPLHYTDSFLLEVMADDDESAKLSVGGSTPKRMTPPPSQLSSRVATPYQAKDYALLRSSEKKKRQRDSGSLSDPPATPPELRDSDLADVASSDALSRYDAASATPPPYKGDARQKWMRFHVYHVSRLGGAEEILGVPSNVLLDLSTIEDMTGFDILTTVLDFARVTGDLRDALEKYGRVIFRGEGYHDSAELFLDQLFSFELIESFRTPAESIIIDHTESACHTGSAVKAPRTSAAAAAPEVGIHIAYD